ncbi:MAG: acyltransferase [Kiritimatiellae bacterium]|nr:acyltransferase [Kiritimatiellia bacterium]
MKEISAAPAKRQIVWLDAARFLAMLFVCVSHAGDTFNCNPPAGEEALYNFWGAIWGSLSRFCVPVFAMITGYLLLPVRTGHAEFYKKRIGRVLPPFLFWSVIYCLLPGVIGLIGGDLKTLKVLIPFAEEQPLTFAACLPNIAKILFNFNWITTHMWYVYMLIGLYLILPVVSAWYHTASERAKWGFVGLWGVTLFIPYLRHLLGGMNLWGVCEWNDTGMFYGFAGFTGYLLFGSLLGRMKPWSWGKTAAIAAPLFIAGFLTVFFGFRHFQLANPEYNADWELFWWYCSPQVAAMSAAVFLFAKKFDRLPPRLAGFLGEVNRCGFGVYLCHYALIGLCNRFLVRPLRLPAWLQLPLMAALAFIAAFSLIHFVRRIPGVGRKITG